MDETEVIYGIIGTVPMGEYDPDKKYELLNLVSYDGSSYTVHTDPPKGTPPTDLNYWQVSALGTSKATADSVGTVKPDGITTEVNADGSLSVKTAAQNALGLVKGSVGIKVGTDGSIDVNTIFTQATELANIIAEEAISSVLGKISKAIAVTIGLNENALLKNMLTNMDANDQNKIPTAAFVHKLYERIGMGEDLEIGTSLTNAVKLLNSNLNDKNNVVTPTTGVYYVKFGRIVIVSFSLTINGDTSLGIPTSAQDNIAIKCRNDNDGSFATFYISGSSLMIYLAENYKSGNTYTGAFSYISGS